MVSVFVQFCSLDGKDSTLIEFIAESTSVKKSELANKIYGGEKPLGGKPWKHGQYIDQIENGKVVKTTINVNYLPNPGFAILQNNVRSVIKL